MTDKVFNQSGLPIRRTVDFLPSVFKTETNSKFLGGVLDPLVQPGVLEKLSGFIGKKYGKTFNGKDVYIDSDDTLRSRYQLEPGVIVTNKKKTITNFYDYLDFKNQLNFFANDIQRDDLITKDECYSWAPPIDWDKFVNFREYYWQPSGPPSVAVLGQSQKIESTFRVRAVENGDLPTWLFYPDGLTYNPTIILYRGQTYNFEVNSPRNKFSIRRTGSIDLVQGQFNPLMFYTAGEVVAYNNKLWKAKVDIQGDGSSINEFSQDWEATDLTDVNTYNTGVTNNGIEVGTLTFTVPNDAPDSLFYISEQEPLRTGQFIIKDILENTFIDIEKEILQKKTYTSSNGVKFTNGMVIGFAGKTSPTKYATGRWLIEGVGSSITLIEFDRLTPPVLDNTNTEVLFDNEGFDTLPYDEATSFPGVKDYIISNRASIDGNPWSRNNRWFHKSVLEYSHSLNNSSLDADESLRAKRPIIEYAPNVQLFDHCAIAKVAVDFIDNFTKDVFSTIEGKSGYSIDGERLFQGARVLVTADTDNLVKNKIYRVNFIATQYSGNTGTQISLVEDTDAISQAGDGVLVLKGATYRGKMFHFNGTTWKISQSKTTVNQPILFDVYDTDENSFGDTLTYPVSTFTGTTILGYKIGNGVVDKELGISLSYLNIDNIGDVLFTANWDTDTFAYQQPSIATKKINTGFLKINAANRSSSYTNTWEITASDYLQPVVDSILITKATNIVAFDSVYWNQASKEKIVFYKNGLLFNKPFTRQGLRKEQFVFEKNFAVDDVISIKVYSDAEADQGFYEIPTGLEKNPLNQDLVEITYGQVLDHLGTMVELDTAFTGVFPGSSNIRDITGFQKYGRRLVKHEGVLPLSLMLICDKDVNVIKSINYSALSYQQFKNNFLTLATTLEYDQNPVNFVDAILNEMSKIKNIDNAFSDSDMIGAGSHKNLIYKVEDQVKTFALTTKFDLNSLSRIAVYVYKNQTQLLHGTDYTFNKTFGYLNLLIDVADGDVIEIREYNSTSYAFIPSTPTKLGLYKKYTPTMFIDDTYITPTQVIQGHDGSIVVAYDDYRDELLMELEKRIYNNIKAEYDPAKFDIDAILGGYYGTGVYTKAQLDKILEPQFLSWITNSNVDYVENSYLDTENSFTYTYSDMTDFTQERNLLGWWRGIYLWFYDTDRPHTSPWEMLGFSQRPTWWESEYGPAPYTRGNTLLWEDLRDGIIRQGTRAGTYNRYARPSLLSHLPVDDQGRLISPLQSNLAQNFSLINATGNFKFGDVGPAEAAWRKSPSYPFAIVTALSLMKPFEFIPKAIDVSRIKKNKINQTVHTDTNVFLSIDAIQLPVPLVTQTSGLLNYIADFLKGKDQSLSILTDKVKNIDVRLSNKIGGFVDQAQQRYLLDSKNPKSKSSSVFIPQEDYDIIFNIGTPFLTINYSGVIVEKVNTGWKLSGYDNKNPFFNYYQALESKSDPLVSVGGVTDTFLVWTASQYYAVGEVVKNGDKYYRVVKGHTSGNTFDDTQFKQLARLDQVGAVEVNKRQYFNKTETKKIAYSTVLPTLQSVADFLYGYEQYLLSLGIVFDEYNYTTQSVNDWSTSIKEFLFWSKHNWAEGQLITLSPAAYKFDIRFLMGSVDNLLDSFYEYTIFKKDGNILLPAFINVNRDYQTFSISVTDTTDGIYFVNLNFVLKEHVVVFKDKTVFNDVLYDKTSGYRQDRVKVIGYRTTDWDGDYTSPGFLFDNVNIQEWQPFIDYGLGDIVSYREFNWTSQAKQTGTEEFDDTKWTKLDSHPTKGLVANFDYRINQFEDYYDLDADGLSSSHRDLARHAVGYQQRDYLNNLSQDPVSQFKIYQGFIREKGTANAITKIFDKLSRTDSDSISLKEEWAFRVGDFGGTDQFTEFEFLLDKGKFKLTPQPIIISEYPTNAVDTSDLYYRIPLTDFTIKSVGATSAVLPMAHYDVPNRNAGYVKIDQADAIVKTIDDITSLSVTDISYGSHVWITFDPLKQWNVLRYTRSNMFVQSVIRDNTTKIITVTCNMRHGFNVGDVISISGIVNLSGFFKILTVDGYDFGIKTSVTDEPILEDSYLAAVGYFEPARFNDARSISPTEFAKLKVGNRLFLDVDENDRWEVLEKINSIYSSNLIDEYGFTQPVNAGVAVLQLIIRNQTIVSIPGSNAVVAYTDTFDGKLRSFQTLTAPDFLETRLLGKFGYVLNATPDEKWLFVGSPLVSGVGSRFQGDFSTTAFYNQNDIVIFAGKLWRALRNVNGDGSSINVYTQDWEIATNILADTYNSIYVNTKYYRKGSIVQYGSLSYIALQNTTGRLPIDTAYWAITTAGNAGYIKQGVVTVYQWKNEQWTEKETFVSPRPQPEEKFGFSISSAVLADGSYQLAVSAPGATNNTGAVYLYKLNSTDPLLPEWELIEDSTYLGIYDQTRFYPAGSIVWYGNKLWKALADNNGDGSSITVNSADWIEMSDTITQSSLPTSAAIIEDGLITEVGILNGTTFRLPEIVKAGDEFGHSISLSTDGLTLVVGSPYGDEKSITNYKGVWVSYQLYTSGDVVRYNTEYYRVTASTSINDIPATLVNWTFINFADSDSASKKFGKLFVYKRNSIGVYQLFQTVSNSTIPSITDIGLEVLEAGDRFGASVDTNKDGTVIIASAPFGNINFADNGYAYVLKYSSTENKYKLTNKFSGIESSNFELFGTQVKVTDDADKIVISAQNSITKLKVKFDNNSTTFDKKTTGFFKEQGSTGRVYVYEQQFTEYFLAEELDATFIADESFGSSLDVKNNTIVVGSPTYKVGGLPFGQVRKFKKQQGELTWNTIGAQPLQVNIGLLKSIGIYDTDKNELISDIDIVDHYKYKFLGIVEQELDFKVPYDPAIYSFGTDEGVTVDTGQTWYEKNVGKVWINMKNVKWINYEQGDIAYRAGHWNELAKGATVDVFEWVETLIVPSEWSTIADTTEGLSLGISGQPLYPNDTSYNTKIIYDEATGTVAKRLYYYWVKNSANIPDVPDRKLSTAAVALYITNPTTAGIPFVAMIDENKFLAYNFEKYLPSTPGTFNFKFYKNDSRINLVHHEYHLLTEGVAGSVPTTNLENKWIDSLIGYDMIGNTVPDPALSPKQRYGTGYRPRQSMFVNRQTALKVFIDEVNSILETDSFADIIDFTTLNSIDEIPNSKLNLYDITLDTYADLITVNIARIKPALIKGNLVDGKLTSIDIIDAGFGYRVAPPVVITGTGTGASVTLTIDNSGRVSGYKINNAGKKYDSVTLTVRAFSVLVNNDETYNNYWSVYQFDSKSTSFFRSLTQDFDTTRYWSLKDWWAMGYGSSSRVVEEIPGTYYEPQLARTIELKLNDLIKITEYGNGGWAVLKLINESATTINEKYQIVGRHNGTFEFSSLLYDESINEIGYDNIGSYDSNSYDRQPVSETRNIIKTIRDDILINDLAARWNQLFFNSVHYIFSEQLYVDWAFKTSFLNAIHRVGGLDQKTHYKNDNLESYEEYLKEVKPYRTKIREYTSSYDHLDNTNSAMSDFDLPPYYDEVEGKLVPVKSNNELLNTYPWKAWKDNNTFKITNIVVYDEGSGYINTPSVDISGGGGQGAKAQAFTSNGVVTGVVVTEQGFGYTSAPTITLVGGYQTSGTEAKATAFIGNGVVRSFDVTMKFDRISKTGTYQNFFKTETITADGLTAIYDLKYPPTTDKSKITVSVNGSLLLSNEYNIMLFNDVIDGLTVLKGKLAFTSTPIELSTITISYEKNDDILDSIDRINKHYVAKDGMLGKDPKQLMTGLDFGGVVIQGSSFNSTGGWDALPWFSDSWDSVIPNADYYIVADGSTTSITLPYTPSVGQAINIYIKRGDFSTLPDKTGRFSRIDDPYFNLYDGSTIQANGNSVAAEGAIMNTFIGNGVTKEINLPYSLHTQAGDILIFRSSDSDGTVSITDTNVQDTTLSGGNLSNINNAYSTANGLTADEISINGDTFISPYQVPAPEENVPGQVLDSVSIKTFQRTSTGAAQVRSVVKYTDGATKIFKIGNPILESKSVIVYVDKIKQTQSLDPYNITYDYYLNLIDQQIEFNVIPPAGKIVEVVTIGPGGYQILDYEEFVGDGTTTLFLTSARFEDTRYILVTVNGIEYPANFITSKGLLNDKDNTVIQFAVPPAFRESIKILVLADSIESDSSGQSVIRINEQFIVHDGSTMIYNLDKFVNLDRSSAAGNMIVEVNGRYIDSADALFFKYDGINNSIIIGQDPLYNPGSIDVRNIKVYIDEQPIDFIRQWSFNGIDNRLTVLTEYLKLGAEIRIEVQRDDFYRVENDNLRLLPSLTIAAGDIIKVTWFSEYPTMSIIKDRFPGNRGVFKLRRQVDNFSTVWIYKNGTRLTPDVDYSVDINFSFIKLKNSALATDAITLIVFGQKDYELPISYEIFKDMLNVNHYKRYSIGTVKLDQPLNYYDTEIIVNNASDLITPDLPNRVPGMLLINNERIEYYTKTGNVLGQLTRGIQGSSTPEVHAAGTDVADVSVTESLPYREYQEKEEFISDGSSLLIGPLMNTPVKATPTTWYRSSIPSNFGPNHQYEVFVNGKRLRKDPYAQYLENNGSYSPAADINVEAEFSVDGTTAYIRLTSKVPAGTKITIISRSGKIFYDSGLTTPASGASLILNDSVVAKFLRNKRTKLPE